MLFRRAEETRGKITEFLFQPVADRNAFTQTCHDPTASDCESREIKHKEEIASKPADNAAWLWVQIRAELDAWADSDGDRTRVPNYLVFITNVPLTPFPDAGGHDALNTAIHGYIDQLSDDSRDTGRDAKRRREARLIRMRRVKKWRLWDANQISRLLDVHGGVRRSFPAFLTAADIFENLGTFTENLPLEDLQPALRSHARTTLAGEGYIYFDEAGSGTGRGIPIHEVAVDLPILGSGDRKRSTVIREVLDRAEHVLRPRTATIQPPHHLVVTGAPGNGKTTISKFLVQVFRAAMLQGAADLSTEHQRIIRGTDLALGRFGLRMPRHRRWPIRIDLAEYAQEGGLDEDSTLIRWISHKVSKRSNAGNLRPSALQSWMRQWPCIVVLDGLDEVTEPAVRKRLIQQVIEIVNDAEADNHDLLVVLTTRPIGYTESIAPTHFARIDLDYLEPSEAVRYGSLATRVRLAADLDRIEQVNRQLVRAANDDALVNLLRTPLQVLIVTIIIDGAGQLSPDRFSLFWGYYDTVLRRERAKPGKYSYLLKEYAQQIQLLHEHVGFELQARCEAADRSEASLSSSELRSIAAHLMLVDGFDPNVRDAGLLDSIIAAATQRLVLIAPRGDEGYGFDVRSLQELMAAMHLTAGQMDDVVERLRRSAVSPHWRNAWIFGVGRLFAAHQNHLKQQIVELIESIDDDAATRLGRVAPIGPRLALEVIDDGMARGLPKWRERLVARGLRVLDEPECDDLPELTRILVRFADSGDAQRTQIADGLRDALSSSEVARATAEAVQRIIPAYVKEVTARMSVQGLTGVRKHPGSIAPSSSSDGWDNFGDEIATYPLGASDQAVLDRAASAVRKISLLKRVSDDDSEAIACALAQDTTAEALEAALLHVAQHEPVLVSVLRDEILPTVYRQPIGDALRLSEPLDQAPR